MKLCIAYCEDVMDEITEKNRLFVIVLGSETDYKYGKIRPERISRPLSMRDLTQSQNFDTLFKLFFSLLYLS